MEELSSCKWERCGSFLAAPLVKCEEPLERGNPDIDGPGELLCREPRLLKTNLGSILSRLFGWGARLLAAYGSLASPAGVKGLLYAAAVPALLGLDSLEVGLEFEAPGPIEKAVRCCFDGGPLDSADRLVSLVESWPGVSGLDEVWSVLELGGAVSAISGPASESASTFCNGAPLVTPSIEVSRDPDAEGVSGGVPISDARGLASGEGRPDDS